LSSAIKVSPRKCQPYLHRPLPPFSVQCSDKNGPSPALVDLGPSERRERGSRRSATQSITSISKPMFEFAHFPSFKSPAFELGTHPPSPYKKC
jgi:hypothetical protein